MIIPLFSGAVIALGITYFFADTWMFWFTLACVILAFAYIWARLR